MLDVLLYLGLASEVVAREEMKIGDSALGFEEEGSEGGLGAAWFAGGCFHGWSIIIGCSDLLYIRMIKY